MNFDVEVRVTLDLSGPLMTLVRKVVESVSSPRADDLDERIQAAVERAVRLATLGQDEAADTLIVPASSPEPVPVTPSSVAVAPKLDEGPLWTETRQDIVRFEYSVGQKLVDILPLINACPGPRMSLDELQASVIVRRFDRARGEA